MLILWRSTFVKKTNRGIAKSQNYKRNTSTTTDKIEYSGLAHFDKEQKVNPQTQET